MKALLFAVLCALAFAACTGAHPNAVIQAQGREVSVYVTPAIAGESNSLRIDVRGSRIPDIREADWTMPDMPMPPQRIPLKDDGNGRYSASNIRFSMAGTWRAAILERTATATRQFASLDVTVR